MIASFLIVGAHAPVASAAPCRPDALGEDPVACARWVVRQAEKEVDAHREQAEQTLAQTQEQAEQEIASAVALAESTVANARERAEREAANALGLAERTLADAQARAEASVGMAQAAAGEAIGRSAAVGDALASATQLANEAAHVVEERVASPGPLRCPVSRGVTPPPSGDAVVAAGLEALPHRGAAREAAAIYEDVRHLDAWCAEQLGRV